MARGSGIVILRLVLAGLVAFALLIAVGVHAWILEEWRR